MTGLQATVGVTFATLSVDVTVEAAAGEIVGIAGANGAGKTTLLRTIAGLQPLDAGRIVIGDAVVDEPESGVFVPAQQRRVGYVFQDYRLFPTMTALDNVAAGLRREHGRRGARSIASSWLDRFDLQAVAHLRPGALSGGQAQRVALARALAVEPSVLLLDEPLAASDPTARQRLRSELTQHLAEFDGVTLLVSHDRDDLVTLATRSLVIDRGRVVPGPVMADLGAS